MIIPAENQKDDPENAPAPVKRASGWMVFAFFATGFIVSILGGWFVFPKLLYSEKPQPIDFNHAIHLDQVSDGCNSCHYFREDGSFAGVPDLSACTDCHASVMGTDPGEETFVNEYVSNNKEVPWLIYSRQPDCVFFSHAAHVKKAGMTCESCHGDIGHSTTMKPYEENRITGYSRDIWGHSIARLGNDGMKMNDCAACHQEKTGSKGACFQCHK